MHQMKADIKCHLLMKSDLGFIFENIAKSSFKKNFLNFSHGTFINFFVKFSSSDVSNCTSVLE